MCIHVDLGDLVRTCDGHRGRVIKKYHVTGVSTPYVHIREADGRIWYCPISDIVTLEGGAISIDEETVNRIMDEILRDISAAGCMGHR